MIGMFKLNGILASFLCLFPILGSEALRVDPYARKIVNEGSLARLAFKEKRVLRKVKICTWHWWLLGRGGGIPQSGIGMAPLW